jgi:hypothetical protein
MSSIGQLRDDDLTGDTAAQIEELIAAAFAKLPRIADGAA